MVLTAQGGSKILGIPKVEDGTGKVTAEAVHKLLCEWNVSENINAMCFDTAPANSGSDLGAAVILASKLNTTLLHLACRHHIAELIIGNVFTHTLEITTSGPQVTMFENFKSEWPKFYNKPWKSGVADDQVATHFPDEVKQTLIDFIQNQRQRNQERADYLDFLDNALRFLGINVTIKDHEKKVKKPGATSRARWMSKINYCLKMFLFRDHFKMNRK